MSLINKMLKDLDARGSSASAELPPDIRAAAIPERRLPRRQVIIAASALTVCAAVAAVIWLKSPAPAPASVIAAAPVPQVPQPQVPAAPQVAPEPRVALTVGETAAPEPAFDAAPEPVKPTVGPVSKPVETARVQSTPEPQVQARPSPAPLSIGREVTVAQRAENAYRQALASLDEGKVTAAYASLDAALKLNPKHDAARQSLVGLLIEDGRNDEAMQQLEQGLAADAGQPALAMLLARMQIERGASGVSTLQRTLPAATGNGDYHAFLAGALQREQRHKEAVAQYAAALGVTPNHGVWLMGMGISLQAEKRNSEAAEAFRRARASGMLTPALDTFVERRLQQLAP